MFLFFFFKVRIELLNRNVRTLRVNKLEANTKYLICVIGLGNWVAIKEDEMYKFPFNSTLRLHPFLDDTVGKCTEVKTLEAPEIAYGKGNKIILLAFYYSFLRCMCMRPIIWKLSGGIFFFFFLSGKRLFFFSPLSEKNLFYFILIFWNLIFFNYSN